MRLMQLAREGSPPPDCAFLRPNCHANPISWFEPGFASSNLTCPARQLVFNSPMQGIFDLVKVVMTRPQAFNTACGLP